MEAVWQPFEKELKEKGYTAVCGVDEAGRGPLAGPVCAAAVILPDDVVIEGLNDSKKLSEKKREKLFSEICEKAVCYSIAFATEQEIDEINILQATFLAMKRAVEGLSVKADYVLVDGDKMPPITADGKSVIKGDAVCKSIAAASILAKVERDRYCLEMDEKYPEYGFAKHKGYPTEFHRKAVVDFGPCPEHRLTFLKKIL